MTSTSELVQQLLALGVRPGGVLLVHTSFRRVRPIEGGPLDASVTYDAPCHLLHAQRVAAPPLKVLAAIPGLKLVPLTDADYCCGAAGIYNLLEPETSAGVLAPKLENIERTGATFVATGNPGCLMQIGAGLRHARSRARTVHPVDLLDASYARRFGDAGR